MGRQRHDLEKRAAALWGDTPHLFRPQDLSKLPASKSWGNVQFKGLDPLVIKHQGALLDPGAGPLTLGPAVAGTPGKYSTNKLEPVAAATTFGDTGTLQLETPISPLFLQSLKESDIAVAAAYYTLTPAQQSEFRQMLGASGASGPIDEKTLRIYMVGTLDVRMDLKNSCPLVAEALLDPAFPLSELAGMARSSDSSMSILALDWKQVQSTLPQYEAILKHVSVKDRPKALAMLNKLSKLPDNIRQEVMGELKVHGSDMHYDKLDGKISKILKHKTEELFGVHLTSRKPRYWSVGQLVQTYNSLTSITGVAPGQGDLKLKGMEIQLRPSPDLSGDLIRDLAPVTGFFAAPGSSANPTKHPLIVLFGNAEVGTYKLTPELSGKLARLAVSTKAHLTKQTALPGGLEIPAPAKQDVVSVQKFLSGFQTFQRKELMKPVISDVKEAYEKDLRAENNGKPNTAQMAQAVSLKPGMICDPKEVWVVGKLIDQAVNGPDAAGARERLAAVLGSMDPQSGLAKAVLTVFGKELENFRYGSTEEHAQTNAAQIPPSPPYLLSPKCIPPHAKLKKGAQDHMVLEIKGADPKHPILLSNLGDLINQEKVSRPLGAPPHSFELTAEDLPIDNKFFNKHFGTVSAPREQFFALNPHWKSLKPGDKVLMPPIERKSVTDHIYESYAYRAYHETNYSDAAEAYQNLEKMPPLAFDGSYGTNTIEAVRQLQEFLISAGYPIPTYPDPKNPSIMRPDGIFGPQTAEYFMDYLLRKGPNGAVNPLVDLITHESGHHMQYVLVGAHDADLSAAERENKAAALLKDFSTISQWTDDQGHVADGRISMGGKRVAAHELDDHAEDIVNNLLFGGQVDGGTYKMGRTDLSPSEYGITDPKEDFAESYRLYINEPTALMKKSPEKFLFFAALERQNQTARYSDEDVLRIAKDAHGDGYKVRLEDALRTLSGRGSSPHLMRAETLANIMEQFNGLIPQLHNSGIMDPWGDYAPIPADKSVVDRLVSKASNDPGKFAKALETFPPKDDPGMMAAWKELGPDKREKIKSNGDAIRVIGALHHLNASEKDVARQDPVAYLEKKGIQLSPPWKLFLSDPQNVNVLLSTYAYVGGELGPSGTAKFDFVMGKIEPLQLAYKDLGTSRNGLMKFGVVNGELDVKRLTTKPMKGDPPIAKITLSVKAAYGAGFTQEADDLIKWMRSVAKTPEAIALVDKFEKDVKKGKGGK